MRYREHVDDDDDSEMLDMSIVGDEEEQHRIELEHNLQDLSIQLSVSNPSNTDEDEHGLYDRRSFRRDAHNSYAGMESSDELEYPRHNPRPHDVSIFDGQHSILEQPHIDYDSNYYSYRVGDEEDGTHYAVDTMSTAAHHASAVTLSAGLAGRGGKRAHVTDASISGAEYDPDRPLDNVVKGVINDLSMLNMNVPKSKPKKLRQASSMSAQVSFDPAAISHSRAFDRSSRSNISRTYSQPGMNSYRMEQHRSNPHIHSESHFSPPRSSQARRASQHFSPSHDITPRAKSKTKQPSFNIQPPTPSMAIDATDGSSRFGRLARGLARDIGANQSGTMQEHRKEASRRPKPLKKSRPDRVPFQDVENTTKSSALKAAAELYNQDFSRSKGVQLPDVTGLTSAVGSPLRKDLDWRGYREGDSGEDVEAQLLQTLTALQTRLNQLESQNLMSRRRVRELELELEACKADVKRERTRVLEREEIIVAQQKDFTKRRAGPSKVRNDDANIEELEKHYKEVVEEKKALEALISTLRSHLSRLTSELSSHQAQLAELRTLHEADLYELREKLAEVDQLKVEIERLAGEVVALRGIVEEGLEERRKAKESSEAGNGSHLANDNLDATEASQHHSFSAETDAEKSTAWEGPSPNSSMRRSQHMRDRTTCTERATVGSSHLANTTQGRFLEDDEIERVSTELEERRSERSESSSASLQHSSLRRDTQDIQEPESLVDLEPAFRTRNKGKRNRNIPRDQSPHSVRPSLRTREDGNNAPQTPFPHIRGERLERLFFSAPEHNAKTCRVCHRRRRPGASDDEMDFPSWMPPRKRTRVSREDAEHIDLRRYQTHEDKSDDTVRADRPAGYSSAPFAEGRLPPQTVLVRVLRELEDDFTHYKGIYIELADQYKLMDPSSNVLKRNVLAEHLKEVVDTLEQKGDQIASLYDLLSFKDKPVSESVVPDRLTTQRPGDSQARRQRMLKKHTTYSG